MRIAAAITVPKRIVLRIVMQDGIKNHGMECIKHCINAVNVYGYARRIIDRALHICKAHSNSRNK